MKKVPNKVKKENVKNVAKRPRLSKEEREARKLKLQEEHAAKKAARLAKREAKKQKEAEKKAAAKAKREERKAKKVARLQAEKERKEAMKLKKQERAEAKKAREAARAEKKAAREAKKADPKDKKVAVEDKIEYERNEWKALSAIRRYVKDEAKVLGALEGDKLERKLKKLEKMGYEVKLENGVPLTIGYSFSTEVKVSKAAGLKIEKAEKVQKSQKIKEVEEVEVQQPQDSTEPQIPAGKNEEEKDDEEEEKLLSDEEISAAAAEDKETQDVEVLAGDTFKDESEIANDDSLGNLDDDDVDGDDDEDEDDDDDIFGAGGNVSREQEDYRREAFRDMEANGAWD